MAKKDGTGGADKVDATLAGNHRIGIELDQIREKLGGYDKMVEILKGYPGFQEINKSTFSYWKKHGVEGNTSKTRRRDRALAILRAASRNGDTTGKALLGVAYNPSLWNLPITLVCWQPQDSGKKGQQVIQDLKTTVGLGLLQARHGIIVKTDLVDSGSEALARLRDDPSCSIAIVANDLVKDSGQESKGPYFKLCPISRPRIEGITRDPVKTLRHLRNKQLGYPRGSAVADVIGKFFKRQALKPPVFVDMPHDAVATATALRDGELFGFVGWYPELGEVETEMGLNMKFTPIPRQFLPRLQLDIVINLDRFTSPDLVWSFVDVVRDAARDFEEKRRTRRTKLVDDLTKFFKGKYRREDIARSLQNGKFGIPYIYTDAAIEIARLTMRTRRTDG